MNLKKGVTTFFFLILPLIALQIFMDTQKSLVDLRAVFNCTQKLLKDHDQDILVFTRVPKTASFAMNAILEQLRDLNNFTTFAQIDGMPPGPGNNHEYVSEPDSVLRKQLIDAIIKEPNRPFVYARHQNFLDFSEFYSSQEKVQPIYFSIVRDPIARLISWYYYARSPDQLIDKESGKLKTNILEVKYLKETFEECLALQRPMMCRFIKGQHIHNHISQMSFFCGHSPECQVFESPAMLSKAKENLEKHFSVVGVTEHFSKSLAVFESHLPRYFKGSRDLIAQHPELLGKNRNIYNFRGLQPQIHAQLSANFSLEIEFYQFARQRLLRQYLSL